MALWRIQAIANPDDGRWQGRKIWKEVIVRAPTAALARLRASDLDTPAGSRPEDASKITERSGFNDEKLYWVQRLDREDEARLGAEAESDAVIAATLL